MHFTELDVGLALKPLAVWQVVTSLNTMVLHAEEQVHLTQHIACDTVPVICAINQEQYCPPMCGMIQAERWYLNMQAEVTLMELLVQQDLASPVRLHDVSSFLVMPHSLGCNTRSD